MKITILERLEIIDYGESKEELMKVLKSCSVFFREFTSGLFIESQEIFLEDNKAKELFDKAFDNDLNILYDSDEKEQIAFTINE